MRRSTLRLYSRGACSIDKWKMKKKIVNRQLSIVNWTGLVEFAARTAKRRDGVAQQTQP